MSDKQLVLRDFALQKSSEVKRMFDDNYLDIIDRLHSDLPMRYKIDFIQKAQLSGADPRKNQIHLTTYNSKDKVTGKWGKVGVCIFSYHFFLSVANQTGQFENSEIVSEVEDVFNPIKGESEKQLVSTATVYRKGRKPVIFKARWKECYNPKNLIWASRPYQMLEKTALANALRWAFPETMSGMFISEEINDNYVEEAEQTFNHEDAIEVTNKKIDNEKQILEDAEDMVSKDVYINTIGEFAEVLTKGFDMQEKGKWMKDNLSVKSFHDLKQFSKKSLKSAVMNLKDKKENRFTTEEIPWED